jgi:predicted histone-like DNA-binding protein
VKGKEFSSFDNEILEKVNNKINDMAIEYIKKRQKLYRNSKTKEVYLAKANYNNYINSRVLSEEVSKRCSISATIVTMVLQEVEGCIASHLASGDVVKLDAIGNFAPTITAKAQDNPEKVNKFSIEKNQHTFLHKPNPKRDNKKCRRKTSRQKHLPCRSSSVDESDKITLRFKPKLVIRNISKSQI